MSASRPYYDSPYPPDPMLDVVYDSVVMMFERQPGFGRALADVAGLVARSIAGSDGAGVALIQGSEVMMRVSSSSLVERADDVQYSLNEGPCVTAVVERRSVRATSWSEQEDQWPRFAHGVRELGIGSVLSLPLVVRDDVIGSVNVYGRREGAFLEADAASGERLARPVAAAIRSSQVSRHLDDMAGRMHETLQVQALISAAIGFLRHRRGLDAEDAHQFLSDLAADRHQSLAEAASAVLEDRNTDEYDETP